MPKRDKDGEIIEDEKDLEYNPDDASQYRARRIEDHWIPVKDAVHQWIQRLGATGIPANFPGVPIPMTAI